MINLSLDPTTYDKTYIIADPNLPWSLDGSLLTTQVPACGYIQTLTSATVPSFITQTPGATINYLAQSRNVEDARFYSITVVSTLNDYIYPQPSPQC
jgi:hypothetical protein